MENLGAMVRYEAWGVEERSEKEEQGYTGCGHPWRRALEVPVVGRTSSGLATSSSPPNGTPKDANQWWQNDCEVGHPEDCFALIRARRD